MRGIRILIVTVAAAAVLAMLSVVALAAPHAVGLAASPSAGAAQAAYCPPGEKKARHEALQRFQRQMHAARKAYFRTHPDPEARKAFLRKQHEQFKALQRAFANCN